MKQNASAHDNGKVLVVGTTPDYIELIRTSRPKKALFITDPGLREKADEPVPSADEEVLCPLDDVAVIKSQLWQHLSKWHQQLTGITCYDCESMEITAMLASSFGLPYPSLEAIRNCRDKFISKQLWQKAGVGCPQTEPVNSVDDAIRFLRKMGNGIVLKPFCGSGSELVFRCRTPKECREAFKLIRTGLKKRKANPLFKISHPHGHLMLAEEHVPGSEFSCDFMLENNTVNIIRMTKKIKSSTAMFGIVSGYLLPGTLPGRFDLSDLETSLLKGAGALGLTRGICMADFILGERSIRLIEMTPRPGGDCLPDLLKEACGIDILGLALDFAEKKPVRKSGPALSAPHIGLRIYAKKAGILKGFDTEFLATEKRLKKIHFSKKSGHCIFLPPEDYDSWILGHMIIQPDSKSYPESQCYLISKRLGVEIEQ